MNELCEEDIKEYPIKFKDTIYTPGDLYAKNRPLLSWLVHNKFTMPPEVRDWMAKAMGYCQDDETMFTEPEKCLCLDKPKMGISKKAPNENRTFYGCANNIKREDGTYGGGCKFFEWGYLKEQEPVEYDQYGNVLEPIHECDCGYQAKKGIVGKTGKNHGKEFFTCPSKKKVGEKWIGGCNYYEMGEVPEGTIRLKPRLLVSQGKLQSFVRC